ncbi:hypothetical protein K443DRAFT_5958 [Laccaria amethystina LaAM-08-1]|uniref:Uncharacterized protein n=1 Tax=Laccaria amethystina LaAM-08-1 TaxID=1095629 RepID=A0A0C9XYA4_9AGAR|nr:hypothetical protein K443DRAFT_5958 [Laccaria amethystina LaAM-08-1]
MLAAWATMMQKENIKAYRAVVVDEEVWSAEVAKSDEAFDLRLNLVCKGCDAWEVACMPSTTQRSNQIMCLTCAQLKEGCSRVAQYMLQKCTGIWEKESLEIEEEDFYKWYPEVMKPQSPYIIREGDETKGKKCAAVKGKEKEKVLSNEEEDDESVVSGGSREGAVGETSGAVAVL